MFMPPRFYKTPCSTARILNFIINGTKERHRIKLNVTGKKPLHNHVTRQANRRQTILQSCTQENFIIRKSFSLTDFRLNKYHSESNSEKKLQYSFPFHLKCESLDYSLPQTSVF